MIPRRRTVLPRPTRPMRSSATRRTARAFDRGEIDADGKPKIPGFRGRAGRRSRSAASAASSRGRAARDFEFRSGGPGGDPFDGNSDIFSQIFGDAFRRSAAQGGGRRQPAPAGADLNVTLDVTIEEAATAREGDGDVPRRPQDRGQAAGLCRGRPDHPAEGAGRAGAGRAGRRAGQDPLSASIRATASRAATCMSTCRCRCAMRCWAPRCAVETPTGRLAVNVPAWSSSDKVLRLKGRGLPEKTGGHADLYAHVRVMLPEGGDPRARSADAQAKKAERRLLPSLDLLPV